MEQDREICLHLGHLKCEICGRDASRMIKDYALHVNSIEEEAPYTPRYFCVDCLYREIFHKE